MKYETFGTPEAKVVSGYRVHDSDGSTQIKLRPMMNANDDGLFYSLVWKRELWGIPEYGDSAYGGDSGDSGGSSVLDTNYYWIRQLHQFSAPEGAYDSYNYFDSDTSLVQLAHIVNGFDSTGRSDLWSIKESRFMFYQRNALDSYLEQKRDLDSDINAWANSSDSDGATSDDLAEATVMLASDLGTTAFTGPTLTTLIDSAVAAGTWDLDSDFNKLGGVYDTIRNFNLLATLNRNSQLNSEEYDIDQFENDISSYEQDSDYDPNKDSTNNAVPVTTAVFKYFLRIADSDFTATDIETY